jgi:hemolysin D
MKTETDHSCKQLSYDDRQIKEIEAMQEKMVAQKFGAPLQLLEVQQRTKEVERDLELAGSRAQELRRCLHSRD